MPAIKNHGKNLGFRLSVSIIKVSGWFVVFGIFIYSCTSQREITGDRTGRLGIKDSTEYELIVFDTGFDFWYESRKGLMSMHSNEYYQNMNHRYAQEWNYRYSIGDRRVNSYLDYNPKTDYGLDFNYKLFLYFKYFEETNKMQLIPGSGRGSLSL